MNIKKQVSMISNWYSEKSNKMMQNIRSIVVNVLLLWLSIWSTSAQINNNDFRLQKEEIIDFINKLDENDWHVTLLLNNNKRLWVNYHPVKRHTEGAYLVDQDWTYISLEDVSIKPKIFSWITSEWWDFKAIASADWKFSEMTVQYKLHWEEKDGNQWYIEVLYNNLSDLPQVLSIKDNYIWCWVTDHNEHSENEETNDPANGPINPNAPYIIYKSKDVNTENTERTPPCVLDIWYTVTPGAVTLLWWLPATTAYIAWVNTKVHSVTDTEFPNNPISSVVSWIYTNTSGLVENSTDMWIQNLNFSNWVAAQLSSWSPLIGFHPEYTLVSANNYWGVIWITLPSGDNQSSWCDTDWSNCATVTIYNQSWWYASTDRVWSTVIHECGHNGSWYWHDSVPWKIMSPEYSIGVSTRSVESATMFDNALSRLYTVVNCLDCDALSIAVIDQQMTVDCINNPSKLQYSLTVNESNNQLFTLFVSDTGVNFSKFKSFPSVNGNGINEYTMQFNANEIALYDDNKDWDVFWKLGDTDYSWWLSIEDKINKINYQCENNQWIVISPTLINQWDEVTIQNVVEWDHISIVNLLWQELLTIKIQDTTQNYSLNTAVLPVWNYIVIINNQPTKKIVIF